MLKPRRQIEICIFPKIYNVVSFYTKGNYSIGISITQQSPDGKIIRSYKPFIIGSKQNTKTGVNRRAHLRENDQKIHQFMSEQFFITYNEESVFLSSMALFKLELEDQNLVDGYQSVKATDYSKENKFCIHIKLYLNKTKTVRLTEEEITANLLQNMENQQKLPVNSDQASQGQSVRHSMNNQLNLKISTQFSKMQLISGTTPNHNTTFNNLQINLRSSSHIQKTKIIKKVIQIDVRKIYLNINQLHDINVFKRILFSQCQYFSILDMYIGSVYLGTKFRSFDYNLSDYDKVDESIRINNRLRILKTRECMENEEYDCGQILKKSTKAATSDSSQLSTFQQFRKKYTNLSQSNLSSLQIRIKSILNKLKQKQKCYQTIIQQSPILLSCIDNQLHLPINNLKNLKQLSTYYGTDSINQLYYECYMEICQFDQYVRGIWQAYYTMMINIQIQVFLYFLHKNQVKDGIAKKNNSIIHEEIIREEMRKTHHEIYLKRRRQIINIMEVIEEDDIYHPLIILQNYQQKNTITNSKNMSKTIKPLDSSYEITSLVVFVHGYQGSDYDLEKAKNFMSLYSPNSYGLLIKSIQDEIDQDLQHLGLRVATEIQNHFKVTLNTYQTINFVGYSLGGVIIRECLKHLEEYSTKMNLFITFASPHLGVVKNDSLLVGTGIWFLINFNKVKNLKQLNCQEIDKQSLRNSKIQNNQENMPLITKEHEQQAIQQSTCFLERLSTSKCLSWFRKMIVVSSKEDNFVPYYSSRIDPKPEMFTRDQRIASMSDNILKKLQRIQRVEVWFDVEHDINTFDKILGRRAHIEFLENRVFLDLFFRMYADQL